MHCDVDQANSIEHIRQCLEDIGVDRIDHGVNILEDPALVEVVKRRGLGLTICPISNRFVTDGMRLRPPARRVSRISWKASTPSGYPMGVSTATTARSLLTRAAATSSSIVDWLRRYRLG